MVERKQILEAVQEALRESPERGFQQTVELAINLRNVDLSLPANRIDEEILLPNGRGKDATVGVFASGEAAVQAGEVADRVIPPEEIEDLADDKREARRVAQATDFFLAEAPLMPTIGRTLGPILGPRGKMPRPLPPGQNPADQVANLRRTVRVRSRDRRTFHVIVGAETMTEDELADNAYTVLDRVVRGLERRDQNIGSVYVKTTMGPAVRVM